MLNLVNLIQNGVYYDARFEKSFGNIFTVTG